MNQKEINSVRRSRESDKTERLIEFYRDKASIAYPETLEAIRRILVARGVSDPSVDLSAPEGALDGELPYERPDPSGGHAPGYAIAGGFVGGVVGYLLGSSPQLSFGDIITRGAFLEGLNIFLRPAAEYAFNFMLAGVILGAIAGAVVATVIGNQEAAQAQAPQSAAVAGTCPHCGTQLAAAMQFCGKCGRSLSSVACQQCGKPVPPDQQFCGACGARVR